MEQNSYDQLTDLNLKADNEFRQHLYQTTRWTKFISVSVFSFCVLLLLISIIAAPKLLATADQYFRSRYFSEFPVGVLIIAIVFMIGIVGFIYYFLFRFSTKVKTAIATENTTQLNDGLRSLKIFLVITTIISVIGLLNNLFTLFSGS